ncbi:MAG TPA: hypothetical protein VI298_10045 [Geobacteraceae bacterium]
MKTNSATTAKELLKVMTTRLAMQQNEIIKPQEAIKTATEALVGQLELFPEEEKISIIIEGESAKYVQESTGKVLAEVAVFNQAAADGLR